MVLEIENIFIYNESSTEVLDLDEIKEYLKERFPTSKVVLRNGFIKRHYTGRTKELAEDISSIRVSNPSKPFEPNAPLYGEVQFEVRVLEGDANARGVLYDAMHLDTIYRAMLPAEERSLSTCHIVFTDRLIGTFDPDDLRYHARVNICGYPHLISTTGLVEAPAKPRDFYLEKQFTKQGDILAHETLKEKYQGRFIDYEDPRTTEVLKGYVMQCILYQMTGEAFCPDKKCRLYNAHWQEEVIDAQLSTPEFCKEHGEAIGKLQ
jgi:hypothetical protein